MFRAALLMCLLVAGCGPEPLPPLHPATGSLAQGGKPVPGGGLIFVPEGGGGLVVNASVNSDGTFTVQTSRVTGTETKVWAGAPAGRYTVSYHPPGDGQKVGGEYRFPDAVTVEAKSNTFALMLPDDFVLPKTSNAKGAPPAPNPADAGKDD